MLVEDADVKALKAVDPLPYHAVVVVEVPRTPGVLEEEREELASLVAKSLEDACKEANAFSEWQVITAGNLPAAPPDSDLVLTAEAGLLKEAGAPPSKVRSVGLAVGSSLLWLAAGFPGWFVPDCTFENLPLEVRMRARRPDAPNPPTGERLPCGPQSLNFFERASWLQYVAQLVWPPVGLPSNEQRARRSLILSSLEEIEVHAARFSKRNVAFLQIEASEPFVLAKKARDPGEGTVLVFLPQPVVDMKGNGRPPALAAGQNILAFFAAQRSPNASEDLVELRTYLDRLAGPDEKARTRVSKLDLANLANRFPNVYRIPMARFDAKPTLRLELTLDDGSRSTFTILRPSPAAAPPRGG
ncbi:MAG: hypothetical protein HY721_34650 [Planctomycetes bacterium]|nr:hypothetical protein [Planctomycetota bacterium]